MRKRPQGPYGALIMETSVGRWFWSEQLMDLHFIPYGKQDPTIRQILRVQNNTLYGALRSASRLMLKVIERKEKEDDQQGLMDVGH